MRSSNFHLSKINKNNKKLKTNIMRGGRRREEKKKEKGRRRRLGLEEKWATRGIGVGRVGRETSYVN
jgi:hypothetical protein